MGDVDHISVYLDLANDLYVHRLPERALPQFAKELPPVSQNLINELASHAEDAALSRPKRSWAIAAVAHQAAVAQGAAPYIQALSAWYLGRASNQWGQPKRVANALSQAQLIFRELSEPGWVAACDWQLNSLAWTKPDFAQAAKALNDALSVLDTVGFDEFVPQCRLDLAYAQILVEDYDQAQENIARSEALFSDHEDKLNQARCWFYQATLIQRYKSVNDAYPLLEKALHIFEKENSLPDIAKTHYRIAQGQFQMTRDISATKDQFKKVANLFRTCELDLWWAGSINNLGAMYMREGDLRKAANCYEQARERFIFHEIQGWLADNLNDSGILNMFRGDFALSIKQFKESGDINKLLGSPQEAITLLNLGDAYAKIGRYQTSLQYLEQASGHLYKSKSYFRLGFCKILMAITWLHLGQSGVALKQLEEAVQYYKKADHETQLPLVYSTRANIYFEIGNQTEAIENQKKALQIAEISGAVPRIALAKRFLGKTLSNLGETEEGLRWLKDALADFAEMEIVSEQVASLVALGACYSQIGDHSKAEKTFNKSLDLSNGDFPDDEWKAYAGLARLLKMRDEKLEALQIYRKSIATLNKVRHDFKQAALAGAYFHKPEDVIQKAITLSVEENSWLDTLLFIEDSKATTFTQQLLINYQVERPRISADVDDLLAEVNWLRSRLKLSFDNSNLLQSLQNMRKLRSRLKEKSREYDLLVAQLERRNFSHNTSTRTLEGFSLEKFREMAKSRLGGSWIAVDYYIADDYLVIVIVTATNYAVKSHKFSQRILLALDSISKTKQNPEEILLSDLEALGELLIPAQVRDLLTPETNLLISPHKKLHGIPWSALPLPEKSNPLVSLCIPSVIPSLHSLILLWERATFSEPSSGIHGITIGISEFQERHHPLPHVKDEIDSLKDALGKKSVVLTEDDATWNNLLKMSKDGLSEFRWLHIASHAFPDEITGRLSGIALWDKDIWLDQLYELAPLPELVTVSACNSIYSKIYEGDEHIGLPTTCLIAGAKSVIGGNWPVLDKVAASFARQFYQFYFDEASPAKALALTQREKIKQGKQFSDWGSFIHMGLP